MKQTLQLRTSQHLALTPQLQQSIRLLQLSTLELQQELEQILAQNPLLERVDDPLDKSVRLLPDGAIASTGATNESTSTGVDDQSDQSSPEPEANASTESDSSETNWSFDDVTHRGKAPDDENSLPQLEAQTSTLRDYLLEQMRTEVQQIRDRALLELLIDVLDENGYLTESLDEIESRLPPELGVGRDELAIALRMLQSFDPAGIGAHNAAECLTLQLKRLPKVPFVTRRLALRIVESHLTLFAQRDFTKLKKALDCDDEDLREAQAVIRQCNPHPGMQFANDRIDYVVPDVIITRNANGWHAILNQDVVPNLRVHAMYANILKQSKGEVALTTQLQEARWLIKNMRQRFDTILRVSQAIVDRQKNFFTHGAVSMRPLVLREIADTLGLHESTISRVTTQKFMLTPHGMFELKYFFGSHVATEAGGEVSSTAIRALIKQLIGAEDTSNPFSDSKVAEMLGEQGMVVARRTVAKYREALKIPPVNLRRAW